VARDLQPSIDMQSLHTWLKDDHDRLDQLFQALLDAVEAADEPTVSAVWSDFERGLLAHLEVEETELFPVLETKHPETISALRLEHENIRHLLGELGIYADLHALRQDVARELVRMLRAHAALEDRTLYPWAEAAASETAKRSMFDALKAAVERKREARRWPCQRRNATARAPAREHLRLVNAANARDRAAR
jgi:hemerythrin superfamily protein